MKESKKMLVIDTNVLINDPFAIYHFLQENDVCVPPVVLTELDSLKGRKSSAQDAIRLLENITSESNGDLYDGKGISVKYNNKTLIGKFYMKTFEFHSDLEKRSLSIKVNDDLIINTAYCFKNSGLNVELITEDLNFRLKARALGIKSEWVRYLSAPKETLGYLGYRFVSDDVDFMKRKAFLSSKVIIEKLNGDNSYPFTTFSTIYVRGRSIQKSFIIIDEAQNLTPHQIKTIITRAGEGTKIVLLGDISQVDVQRYLRSDMNGLTYVMSNLKGKKLFASFRLEKVERSALAKLGTMLP